MAFLSIEKDLTDQQRDDNIQTILRHLQDAKIVLNDYRWQVKQKGKSKDVYEIGPDIGMKFTCDNFVGLTNTLENSALFRRDDRATFSGCMMALVTKGVGYRLVGTGNSIHFQIDKHDCDVHIDSRGIVDSTTNFYSLSAMLRHLNADLIPSFVPSVHLSRYANISPFLSLSTRFDIMRMTNDLFKSGQIQETIQTGVQVYDNGSFRAATVVNIPLSLDISRGGGVNFDVGKINPALFVEKRMGQAFLVVETTFPSTDLSKAQVYVDARWTW